MYILLIFLKSFHFPSFVFKYFIYYSLVIFRLPSPFGFCCATDIGCFLFTFSRKCIGLKFIAVVSSVYVYARSLFIKPDKFLF